MDNNNKQDIFITVQCTIGKSKKVETFGFNFSDLTHTVGNELYLKLNNLRITLEPGELQKITEQVNFAKPVMEQKVFRMINTKNIGSIGSNAFNIACNNFVDKIMERGYRIDFINESRESIDTFKLHVYATKIN